MHLSGDDYYDAAGYTPPGASHTNYGIEFDIFETNCGGTTTVPINFFQHTGHFGNTYLTPAAPSPPPPGGDNGNPQCITYSSNTNFDNEPECPGSYPGHECIQGAPNALYRIKQTTGGNIYNFIVHFPNPDGSGLQETTISVNNTIVWNSTWIIGGRWDQWPSGADEAGDAPYPCYKIGNLNPFFEIAPPPPPRPTGADLHLQNINTANTAGYWMIIGMNPFFAPQSNSYNANHSSNDVPPGSGSVVSNGKGGGVNIQDFKLTQY